MNNIIGSGAATRYRCAKLSPERVVVKATVFADSGKLDAGSPVGPAIFRATSGNFIAEFASGASFAGPTKETPPLDVEEPELTRASLRAEPLSARDELRPDSARKATTMTKQAPKNRFATLGISSENPVG